MKCKKVLTTKIVLVFSKHELRPGSRALSTLHTFYWSLAASRSDPKQARIWSPAHCLSLCLRTQETLRARPSQSESVPRADTGATFHFDRPGQMPACGWGWANFFWTVFRGCNATSNELWCVIPLFFPLKMCFDFDADSFLQLYSFSLKAVKKIPIL